MLQKLAPGQVGEEPAEARNPPLRDGAPAAAPGAHRGDGEGVIKVKGIDDLMVYRAKCCNPIRGESIVGYVTRGKGVAVHSKACPNVQSLMYDVERKIEVEWARAAEESFPVRLIDPHRRPPRHAEPAHQRALCREHAISAAWKRDRRELDHDGGVVEMTVDVRDKKQLEKLVSAMRRISGVRDVERLFKER